MQFVKKKQTKTYLTHSSLRPNQTKSFTVNQINSIFQMNQQTSTSFEPKNLTKTNG